MSRYTIKVEEDFYITKYNKKPFPSIYHGEKCNLKSKIRSYGTIGGTDTVERELESEIKLCIEKICNYMKLYKTILLARENNPDNLFNPVIGYKISVIRQGRHGHRTVRKVILIQNELRSYNFSECMYHTHGNFDELLKESINNELENNTECFKISIKIHDIFSKNTMTKLPLNIKIDDAPLLPMNIYNYSAYAKFNKETLFYDVNNIEFNNSHLNIKREFEFLNSIITFCSSDYNFSSSYYDCCAKFKNNILKIANNTKYSPIE